MFCRHFCEITSLIIARYSGILRRSIFLCDKKRNCVLIVVELGTAPVPLCEYRPREYS